MLPVPASQDSAGLEDLVANLGNISTRGYNKSAFELLSKTAAWVLRALVSWDTGAKRRGVILAGALALIISS